MNNETLLSKLDKYNNQFINEKKLLNSSNNTITTYQYILENFYEFIAEQDSINELYGISKEILLKL